MKIKLLAFLLIIFCYCGRKSTNEKEDVNPVLKIDLITEPEFYLKNLSEFATNVEYIPLQTTQSSLIGGIVRKIVNEGEKIYFQSGEEILCFDMSGNYLFKLQNRGRGPEEYTYITDFDVSSDNNILTILSSVTRKLLVYEISETGFTYRRSLTLKDPPPWRVSIVPETDKVFLAIPPWRGTEPTLSLMINTIGDTVYFKLNCYKYKNVRKTGSRATTEMLVYSIGDKVCFKEEFSDTVFYIDANENFFKPSLILNSHGTLPTPEVRGGSESVGDHLNYIANIFEASRYIFYYYIGSGPTRNRFIFDKKTKTKFRLSIESELKDDLSGGPGFNIEFLNYYCSGGKLFSLLDANTLKKYVGSEDFKNFEVIDPKKKKDLKKLADSLNETDNPVLIIVTPKE